MPTSRLLWGAETAPRLTPEEVIALRRGDLELECPLITLTGKSQTFRGGGSIRRAANRFQVAVYSQEPIALAEFPPRLNLPLGEFVPRDQYFALRAVDTRGREWRASHILPDYEFNPSVPGSIVRGATSQISAEGDESRAPDNDAVQAIVIEPLKLPATHSTETITRGVFGESKRGDHDTSRVDVLNGAVFLLRREGEGASVHLTGTELPAQIGVRLEEALQFVAARPVRFAAISVRRRTHVRLTLSVERGQKLSPRIGPPASSMWVEAEQITWRLFQKYLDHICAAELAEDELHPLSAVLRSALAASASFAETEALVVCIGIERLARIAHESTPLPGLDPGDWPRTVDEFLAAQDCPKAMRDRVAGMFRAMPHPRAIDRLYSLAKRRAVSEELVEKWDVLRNRVAHGSASLTKNPAKTIRLLDAVATLMYQLIFHAIGYEGLYSNYAARGWPAASYPPGESPGHRRAIAENPPAL